MHVVFFSILYSKHYPIIMKFYQLLFRLILVSRQNFIGIEGKMNNKIIFTWVVFNRSGTQSIRYQQNFNTGLPIRTVGILEMFMKPLTKKTALQRPKQLQSELPQLKFTRLTIIIHSYFIYPSILMKFWFNTIVNL